MVLQCTSWHVRCFCVWFILCRFCFAMSVAVLPLYLCGECIDSFAPRAEPEESTAIVTFCSLWPLPCVKYLTYLTCFHCVSICPSLTPPGFVRKQPVQIHCGCAGGRGLTQAGGAFVVFSVYIVCRPPRYVAAVHPETRSGGSHYHEGGAGGSFGGSACVCVNLCDVSQNVSFQRASSFATGIVLQRYAITALRRLTKGGQSPHMWRQWFYFSRMFGIVFLPAQSGRACPADSRSSWQRNSWPNGRRLMENRHWTLIPLFSFPLLTGTGIDKQNTQKNTERNRQVSQASYKTHLSHPFPHSCLIPDPPPHFLLLSLCHAVSHTAGRA